MPLAAGSRLGSYEILAAIGAGGMGEVYKARDTRLDRIVAVKILPEHVADDPDFRRRFEREAKAISSLNHPHICALYDVGSEGGVEFLVMEHLEGEVLSQRLGSRRPLPLPQVLRYAVEIAEALDRAHRQGITHRDLKPGNVMLTKSGAKLLDFGLAKLKTVSPVQAASGAPSEPPELLTARGAIVGTLQYMAPEQLEGKLVDHRADIFAFGAIVHEMATGQPAFQGGNQASLIGAILRDDPPRISALQPASPPALDALIATCLAKDPDDRWQSAGDVARQLRLISGGTSHPSGTMPSTATATAPPRSSWRLSLPRTLTALAAGAALAGAAIWGFTRPEPVEPPIVTRFVITPPPNARLANLGGYDVAISPDGRRIAYLAVTDRGGTVLYVRELSALDAHLIPGTETAIGAGNLFFSADSRAVFYDGPGQLMRVSVGGGLPQRVADNPGPFLVGGSSAADGTVFFASGDGALYRVPAGGGAPERLTAATGAAIVAPVLLPGDRAMLLGLVEGERRRVAVLDLETREQRIVAEGGENSAYSPSGHLVFARGTTLMVQPFDLARLDVTGEPVTVLQGVRRSAGQAADFALSANGTLVYVPSREAIVRNALVWVDRDGRVVERVVDSLLETPLDPRLSPDGTRLVLSVGGLVSALWIYDLRGRPPLLLTDGGDSGLGTWSPDGSAIAFTSNLGGVLYETYTLTADGSMREARPVHSGFYIGPSAWTSHGELIGYANDDIVAIDVDGGGEVRAVVATPDAETYPALSPDGRWLAYVSDRTGRQEVWMKGYPDGPPVRLSQNGGIEPVWSRDGRELYYRRGNAMMAVVLDTASEEPSFEPAGELFTGPYLTSFSPTRRSYDVAPDGRFLMIEVAGYESGTAASDSIVVVQNWAEELKRHVPVP